MFKVYSIQETYYQTGNTGMAIHLEGTTKEVTELHKMIMEVIAKAKMTSMLQGDDYEHDIMDSEAKVWAKYVNDRKRQDG